MIVQAALEVAAAAADIPIAFLNGGVLLVLLVVTGTALVMARFLVIEYAPWIGHHSKVLADLLDVELDLIETTVDIVRVGVEVIFAAIAILSGKQPHFTFPKWHKMIVDPAALVALTHELAYGCKDYDSFGTVITASTTQFASPLVCPIVRHTYPIQPLYTSLESVLGGTFSYEATPPPFGNNCEPPETGVDGACIAFGSGYVVLELILPIYIAIVVGQTGLWTALLKLAYAAVSTPLSVCWNAIRV